MPPKSLAINNKIDGEDRRQVVGDKLQGCRKWDINFRAALSGMKFKAAGSGR